MALLADAKELDYGQVIYRGPSNPVIADIPSSFNQPGFVTVSLCISRYGVCSHLLTQNIIEAVEHLELSIQRYSGRTCRTSEASLKCEVDPSLPVRQVDARSLYW